MRKVIKKGKVLIRLILLRKALFALVSVAILFGILQFFLVRSGYFQALAQCLDQSGNPRAEYLITSSTQGSGNRFYSAIGTCIIDPKYAAIGEFRQTSYQQLFEEFYTKSRVPAEKKFSYPPLNDPFAEFHISGANYFIDQSVLYSKNNFHIDGSPSTTTATSLVFIDKDLYINANFVYPTADKGVVFIVQGSVFFNPAVTQFDGVIIAQGAQNQTVSICTATDNSGSCPASSVDVGTNALIINGSLISLDSTKPVRFTRKLTDNQSAAERVNHQVKYLSILNNLLSKPTNVISEGTNYAICTNSRNKPPGCPCDSAAAEQPQCIGGVGQCQNHICQPPTGPIDMSTPVPTPVSSATPSPAPTVAPPVLVAHWPMDEGSGTVVDDVVGTSDGTAVSAPVVTGKIGNARNVSGGYITVPNSASFDTIASSVSVWVYPTTPASNWSTIFDRRNAQNAWSFILGVNDSNKVQCWTTGGVTPASSVTLTVNSWNHIVCTYDGTDFKIYVNNAVVAQATSGSNTAFPANPSIRIGQNINTNSIFPGRIDDLRFYNYALSAEQVSTLCGENCGQPVFTNPWIIEGLYQLFDIRPI